MTPERWDQVGKLYHDALEVEPEHRTAFLDQACAEDASLRREVESLLAVETQVGDFIAAPAFEAAAQLLTEKALSALTGRRLGEYEVLRFLGKGGMGEVYLARDPSLDRMIALKLLLPAKPKPFRRSIIRTSSPSMKSAKPMVAVTSPRNSSKARLCDDNCLHDN
jgi:serine/threonine-protein kinase